ncbi:hypothetical protein AVEN_127002-1 [Araneus ventricosus]|uniref:Uncharacterized protein n=1 Tax=Araneus ventricosus TaxID=182803 RepID=A0A4Y2C1C0_ARAVE|nr:hypothetical protein AVEN_127002-1 [Araneus ventricosus]
MTAGIVRIVRKLPSSPNISGRATLPKKASAADVKSITLNERGWKLQSDIRTAIVFCLMGRSLIDRVNRNFGQADSNSLTSYSQKNVIPLRHTPERFIYWKDVCNVRKLENGVG